MTPKEAFNRIKEIYPERDKKLEAIIATDAEWSGRYARDVLKGRFEEGEDVIATDAGWSYYYARSVLKGRFPLGEEAIATDAIWSYVYARDVLKGRFHEGEKNILKAGYFKDYFKILSEKEKFEILTNNPQLINDLI